MPSNLENLASTGVLKAEAPVQLEHDGLVQSATAQLDDAETAGLSIQSRFNLAYNAAYGFALAALRFHGFRPNNNRHVVFQTTTMTLQLSSTDMRVLSEAHRKRNNSAYEGIVDVSAALVESLIRVTRELQKRVAALGAIP